jgi:hypothetical protein
LEFSMDCKMALSAYAEAMVSDYIA